MTATAVATATVSAATRLIFCANSGKVNHFLSSFNKDILSCNFSSVFFCSDQLRVSCPRTLAHSIFRIVFFLAANLIDFEFLLSLTCSLVDLVLLRKKINFQTFSPLEKRVLVLRVLIQCSMITNFGCCVFLFSNKKDRNHTHMDR